MKNSGFLFVLLASLTLLSCSLSNNQVLYEDDFSGTLDNWVIEKRLGDYQIKNSAFEIIDSLGCSIWFKEKLRAPLKISYEVTVIDSGGPLDRVSDVNCFWMATDPTIPNDFFHNSDERSGIFSNYHQLHLYYVGLGAHDNTKTRFRRYDGNMDRPLRPEHDLSDPEFLITPNKKMTITLVVNESKVQYLKDNEIVFEIIDPAPYRSGYFGFRTWKNHMIIDNFKVESI